MPKRVRHDSGRTKGFDPTAWDRFTVKLPGFEIVMTDFQGVVGEVYRSTFGSRRRIFFCSQLIHPRIHWLFQKWYDRLWNDQMERKIAEVRRNPDIAAIDDMLRRYM